MKNELKAAVVGCGNISNTHLPILASLDGVRLVAVCDTVPEKADFAAEKYSCRAFYDFETMLAEEDIDCVHICTPHYLHVPMAMAALSRGINVLCEKPLAITAESLESLRNLAEESCAILGVCFQNRYNQAVKMAKNIIVSNKFGRLLAVKGNVSWFRDAAYYSDSWHGKLSKEGGGVLVNQAVHTADLLRFLVGSNIKKLEAHVFNDSLKNVSEVEDTAVVRYEFENGVTGILNATNAFSLNADVTLDFFFESGNKLYIEGLELYRLTSDGEIEKLTKTSDKVFHGKAYWGNGHAALISDFYRCIKENRRFPIDSFEGGKATEEFLACYESSKSGKSTEVRYGF